MPPPKHLKKQKDEHAQESLGIPRPEKEIGSNTSLRKVWEQGLPPQPLCDFPLPQGEDLAGTVRERISILIESIMKEEFVDKLQKTNFFDVRSIYKRVDGSTDLHLGEIYAYGAPTKCTHNGQTSNGHAWILLTASPSVGLFQVTQWHHCHGSSTFDKIPTYLFSLENYLMYIHRRIGEDLPKGILK